MFIRDSWLKIVNFISFWYMRYLLVTELYIVEPWERAVMHVLMVIFFFILSYFNTLVAHYLPAALFFVSQAVS